MENVNELFALPVGTEKVGNIFGIDLYTSDSLKKKYIDAIENSEYANFIPNIDYLIKKELVIPVFASKNLISFIRKKFPLFTSFNNDYNPTTMGFYNQEDNKIYILVDNKSNLFGVSENNELGKLLVHELMHLFCASKPELFLKYFNTELLIFYRKAFKDAFQADVPDDRLKEIIRTLCLKFEISKEFSMREPVMFLFGAIKRFSKMSPSELMNTVTDYVLAWFFSMEEDPLINTNNYMRFHIMFSRIYKTEFNTDIKNKDCFQEALFTSEVIAALAESGQMLNTVSKVSKILEKIL